MFKTGFKVAMGVFCAKFCYIAMITIADKVLDKLIEEAKSEAEKVEKVEE